MISISSCEEFRTVSPDFLNQETTKVENKVYFTKELAQQIDIEPDTKSFDIPVKRSFADAAVSVPVTITADSAAHTIFEFPATIEFADSATTATYTVSVKENAVIEYAVYHNITIDIEESMTTPYVLGSYTFTVGAPEPWSEWEEFGTGTFTLAGYWSGTHSELPIYYREYLLNDVDAEFFIPGVANAMDLTIDYNRQTGDCQVDVQYVLNNEKYGPVYVCDFPHYPLEPGLTYEEYPCHYNAETGLFTLNLIYFVSTDLGSAANGYFGMGEETFQLNGFVQPDYSLKMEFKGHYVDKDQVDNAVIATTMGADVASYLMTIISEQQNVNATIDGMLKGEITCDTLDVDGYFAYPISESGIYKALAITFDAEGNAVDAFTEEFEFNVVGEDNPWVSLGMAKYTDDFITTFFNAPNATYEVEVRENKKKPGLFRIINPYGAAYPYNEPGDYDTSREYYIEIDATDHEAVYIPGKYNTGCNWGYGNFFVSSVAYNYLQQGAAMEDIKDAGMCGILADNVITFPAKTLLVAMAEYQNGAYYYSNPNGAFMLDMNDMTPVETAAAKAPVARINAERILKNVEGGISMGVHCKKIENPFLTIKGIEVK